MVCRIRRLVPLFRLLGTAHRASVIHQMTRGEERSGSSLLVRVGRRCHAASWGRIKSSIFIGHLLPAARLPLHPPAPPTTLLFRADFRQAHDVPSSSRAGNETVVLVQLQTRKRFRPVLFILILLFAIVAIRALFPFASLLHPLSRLPMQMLILLLLRCRRRHFLLRGGGGGAGLLVVASKRDASRRLDAGGGGVVGGI